MERLILTDILLAHRFYSPPRWYSSEYAVTRRYHGIVYVLDGRAEYRFSNGEKLVVEKNNWLYLPPGTTYTTHCTPTEAFIHMTVNFDLLGDGQLFPGIVYRQISNSTRFEQVFSMLVHHWTVRHPGYWERCMGLLYEMTYLLQGEVQSPPRQHTEKLEPARRYLDEKFCEDFPLEVLPELCGLSPTYFRRLFRQVFRESPAEYRRRLRIAKAGDLLLSGEYPIEEIARLCGYPDPAYFSRMFKKTMGESPTHYRIHR